MGNNYQDQPKIAHDWKDYQNAGLHVFPISMPGKGPAIPSGTSWTPHNKEGKPVQVDKWVFNGAAAIACGDLSGNVEVIDFDTKNTSRDLMTEYFDIGGEAVTEIYKKLVVQSTVNGGFHFIYKCKTIEGNQDLAKSEDNKKVLIETRGQGGYVVIAPSPGYKVLQGDPTNIPELTESEREILLSPARALNEYWPEVIPPHSVTKSFDNSSGIRPGDDFNQKIRGDDYLLTFGWSSMKAIGDKHHLCRPDKTGAISGTYYAQTNMFHCFTSSTTLKAGGNYSPFALFTNLECNDDFNEGAKRLADKGYGERSTPRQEQAKAVLKKEHLDQIVKHVFLIRSIKASNKFSHVVKDSKGICEYYESTASGKISEPAKHKISEVLKIKWPNITNSKLKVFDEKWIQRDTATTCYLYFQNGTLAITKHGTKFIDGENRAMIWKSLVLQRDYKPSSEIHPICELAKKVVVNYEALQIGLGYLMHRYWSRNMTKIIWACDHKPTSNHDGRRGKDLFLKLVELCRTVTSVKWKKGHNFWTGSITPETSVVHFEDVSSFLANDEEIKRCITGELQIEGKGRDIISRRFEDKPKFSASCQQYPIDYADDSIRGRIWLIEFTNYLQTNPPKKTLIYDDSDLSSFDAWMIDCIQVYFKNQDKLIGTPAMSKDELKEALRSTYGKMIVDAVTDVANTLNEFPHRISIETVYKWCGFKEGDTRAAEKFQKCYQLLQNEKLTVTRVQINGERERFFERVKD